jgi:hypothetical protein
MTGDAINAGLNVYTVVEVNEVGQIVHPIPGNRDAREMAAPDWLE